MRAVAILLPLILVVPLAGATETYEHYYLMGGGSGCAGGGLLIRNCETYFPERHLTNVNANVTDLSGSSVRIRICHEWTYDDGSHPTVRCAAGCSPEYGDALRHPPWPWNTTYRVIVDLRNGPGNCDAPASAGELRVTFA